MNENENLKPVEKLTPFTRMIMSIGTLPSSFYASMSYYESMVWLYEYLKNQIIPTVNNNGEAVEELQNLFIQLQNYVDQQVGDIPEVIDEKISQMVDDGTLADIILKYGQSIKVYDTINDMKTDENLFVGARVKTLGYYSINDNGGSEYYITQNPISNYFNENLENGLNAVLISNNGDINVLQAGIKPEENFICTTLLKNLIKSININKIIFNNGTYYFDENEINIDRNNIEIEGNNTTLHFKSTEVNTACFYTYLGQNNITLKNLTIESDTDQIGTPSAGHTFENNNGFSNKLGFFGKHVTDLYIENCNFKNMRFDIMLNIDSGETERNINKNIYINNIESINTAGFFYGASVSNLHIDNCKSTFKEETGNGEHNIYINNYSNDIFISNCEFINDKYAGVCIYDGGNSTLYADRIYNVNINNVKATGGNGFISLRNTKHQIENVHYISNSSTAGFSFENSSAWTDDNSHVETIIYKNIKIEKSSDNTTLTWYGAPSIQNRILIVENLDTESPISLGLDDSDSNAYCKFINPKCELIDVAASSKGKLIIENGLFNSSNNFGIPIRSANVEYTLINNTFMNPVRKNTVVYIAATTYTVKAYNNVGNNYLLFKANDKTLTIDQNNNAY